MVELIESIVAYFRIGSENVVVLEVVLIVCSEVLAYLAVGLVCFEAVVDRVGRLFRAYGLLDEVFEPLDFFLALGLIFLARAG